MKIAFIGLGHMGGPMALNLHKAGHALTAFDLSAEACDRLAAEGVFIAATAADAVEGAEAVVSMLPASAHVDALYFGADGRPGLLESIAPGALVIDSSTIAAATSRKVAAAGAARGLAVIDAPVSGGTGGAIAGTLTFMVGGAAADLERARPLLDVMGANVFHAGEAGAGQTAKICNNMLLGILMIGTAEAIAL
ncbi:MAG: 3-hydroxyisobutyrate dehydrogenase, partial [Variovorax sp.]